MAKGDRIQEVKKYARNLRKKKQQAARKENESKIRLCKFKINCYTRCYESEFCKFVT